MLTLGGSKGAGTQGRETKTKSTKKKRRGGGHSDESDDETSTTSSSRVEQLDFMSIEEIVEVIKKHESAEDCEEEFLTLIAEHLYRYVNVKHVASWY